MPQSVKEPFLPVIRALARTFQAFEQFSAQHVRTLGLTPPQFDVVATLGNTDGMSCKALSQKTLITKGTLTGVIDRLSEKGLVKRTPMEHDRRSVYVSLTAAGDTLFACVFPKHLAHMKTAFDRLTPQQLQLMTTELNRLEQAFTDAQEQQIP